MTVLAGAPGACSSRGVGPRRRRGVMMSNSLARKDLTSALVVCVALLPTTVQSLQQPPAFPTQAEIVTVDVVVLDRDGKPVPGLTRADFVVREDGRPQNVTAFEAIEALVPAVTAPETARHQSVRRARRDQRGRPADPAHLRDRVRRPSHRRAQHRAGQPRGPGLPRPGHPVGRPADAAHHVGRAVLGHHPRPRGRRLPQRPRSCRVAAAGTRLAGAPDEPRRGDAHRGRRRRLRGGAGAPPTGRALRPLRVER